MSETRFCNLFGPSIVGVSYNQPKLCSTTTWNSNAISLATGTVNYIVPSGLFINLNNTIYVTDTSSEDQLSVLLHDGTLRKKDGWPNLMTPYSIFVTSNDDIYVYNGDMSPHIDKLPSNGANLVFVMSVDSYCYGLFIDKSDTLYCSLFDKHRVIKGRLYGNTTTTTIAGTGSSSSASNTLYGPYGIFVDNNFNLYVADSKNDRIQLFPSGISTGTTVAGLTSSTITIKLNFPSAVVLDADGNLFVVDSGNNRIIGSDITGFRCIIGCLGSGSTPDRLNNPIALGFDSFGNIYVTDHTNSRIQKFNISTNSCGKQLKKSVHTNKLIESTIQRHALYLITETT